MVKLLLLPSSVLALSTWLTAPAPQAPAPAFRTYAQFNDTLVARFNRGEFRGMAEFSSPALRQLERVSTTARFLSGVKAKTGRVVATRVLGAQGQRHEFEWRGEKQNLRLTLVSPAPGVIDDYTVSACLAQPARRSTPAPTLSPKPRLYLAAHRAAAPGKALFTT